MAPKKRPAAAAAGGPTKKPASAKAKAASAKAAAVNEMKEKVAVISEALLSTDVVPMAVTKMLSGALVHALGIYKADRHDTQKQVVDMVGSALQTMEEALRAAIVTAETSTSEAKTAEEAKAAECTEAEKKVTEAQEALEAKQKEQETAEEVEMKAKEALDSAGVAKQEVEDAVLAAQKKKDTVQAVKDQYASLKDGSAANAPKVIKGLVAKLKELNVDASLMESLPPALNKDAAERGEFDTVVFTQLDEECKNHEESCTKTIEEKTAEKATAAEKVTEAETALSTAAESLMAKVEEVNAAKKTVKDMQAALKVAKKTLKDAAPAIKAAQLHQQACEAELQKFETGPKAAFQELSEYAPPAPEVDEIAAAEEPAAAEAAMEATPPTEAGPTS